MIWRGVGGELHVGSSSFEEEEISSGKVSPDHSPILAGSSFY
jgi:hypothetical protein